MNHLLRCAAAVLAAVALLSACGSSSTATDEPDETGHAFDSADTTVEFVFIDSSVAPEYHRSFTLTVVDGTGTVVVDVYGDETTREEAGVDPGAVADLLAAYRDGELDAAFEDVRDDDGCSGGTTFELTLDDGRERAATSVYRCGGVNDELAETLATAVAPLLDAFDIVALTDGRYGR